MVGLRKRIERLEEAFRRSSLSKQSTDCICFPNNDWPFFFYRPVHIIAAAVKCPIHGNRFQPLQPSPFPLADWQWEVEVGQHWPTASEKYRKAWNATFQDGSWPVEEVEIAGRKWLLPRSETGELVDYVTAQTAPPWKRVKAYTVDEVLRIHSSQNSPDSER